MTAAEVIALHSICGCGEYAENIEEQAAHILAALKREGYAVVALPKAEPLDDGYNVQFYAPANGNHVRVRWSKDIVLDGNWYEPDQARDVAAALLAAADTAEALA